MELLQYIKQLQALIYSGIVNFLIALPLYFIICHIPFAKSELAIGIGLWFVYFSFVYIFYCLLSFSFQGIPKIVLSLVGMLAAATTVFTFHFIANGFHFNDIKFITSVILLILLSADIPFLVSCISKKLK